MQIVLHDWGLYQGAKQTNGQKKLNGSVTKSEAGNLRED